MKHRMAFSAMAACAIIAGACADQDGGERLMTEPSGGTPVVSYVTSSSAAIVDPSTHRLTAVTADASHDGVRASIAAGGVSTTAFQVLDNEPGIARVGGRTIYKFTDASNHKQEIVMLYRSTGGPPASMQHYIDGVLVSTTAFGWMRTSNGWLRTQSVMQSLRNGVLVGTYSTATAPQKPGSGGGPVQTVMLEHAPVASPLQKFVGAFAYGLAFAMGPEDASAQTYSVYDCRLEWLRYVGSAVVLAASGSAIGAAPVLTPILISTFVAALMTTAIYEDQLLDCILAHQSLAAGGFGSGGASTWPSGKWDCFDGSYSAHCTTAFTI